MPGQSTEQDGEFTEQRANESKVSGKALTAGQTDLVPCAAPHDSERGKIYWDSLSTIFATSVSNGTRCEHAADRD